MDTVIEYLARNLAKMLARIPTDSEQLEDLSLVLRILKDAIRHSHVSHDLHLLACDIADVAKTVGEDE